MATTHLTLVSRTTDTLLDIEDLRDQLRVSDTDQDRQLTRLIRAAQEQVETDSGICFMDQTWEETFLHFHKTLKLTKKPAYEVVSFKYFNDVRAYADYNSDNYYFDDNKVFISGEYPTDVTDRWKPLKIQYKCKVNVIPERAKQACRLLSACWFENREAEVLGLIPASIKLGYDKLIGSLVTEYMVQ